jgi:hypothetical protein
MRAQHQLDPGEDRQTKDAENNRLAGEMAPDFPFATVSGSCRMEDVSEEKQDW